MTDLIFQVVLTTLSLVVVILWLIYIIKYVR